jgi:hypothetical protein
MKLPTWFKLLWWLLITGLTGLFFYSRLPAISAGDATTVDVFVFLVLVALMLVPIFQEVSFFGLKFKQTIDDLQKNIATQLAVFRADIQTTISNTSNINVTLPSPPPDDQLPDLEERIRGAVSEALQEQGLSPTPTPSATVPKADENTVFLFKTRHTIEKKLRRIASLFADSPKRRPIPIIHLSGILVKQELLHPKFASAIREIYSVCSPAIHGEPVTEAQINFVRDVAPQVIDALTEIERRTIGSPDREKAGPFHGR